MSFRTRLVLAAAYLVAAVVLALEIPLALSIERSADSDFQADVLSNTALLAARISDDVASVNQTDSVAKAAAVSGAVDETADDLEQRIIVTNANGLVLTDSADQAAPGAKFATPERPEFEVALGDGRVDSRRRFSDTVGGDLLLVTVPVVHQGEVIGAVRASASRESVVARVHRSWMRLAAIGLAVVLGAFVLAWFLATTVSRPLSRLRDTARELGEGDLDARAPTDGPAELAALGVSFNRMAGALGSSMRAQRDFVANASHQLRTPLTGIRLRLEAIRADGGVAGENAAKAEEEVDRLEALVDDLLALAGAATPPPSGVTVDLSSVAEDAVERWQAPAGEAEKTIEAGLLEQALVFADPADLAHVVDNLIENALRYTPPGTRVSVESTSENGHATLVVADNGPGIPGDDRTRVFERFYRGSNGRRLGPGTGLGLAIVAELVERWDGQVTLADGPGTRVRVVFRQTPADR